MAKNYSHDFHIGQRWISDTEPDLGLGTIIDQNPRQISVVFLSSGETRIYAKESAPLTRILFIAGDVISTHDDRQLTVTDVIEVDGCMVYTGLFADDLLDNDRGKPEKVSESELNNFLRFNRPQDRLFAGQLDQRKWFNLRHDVFQHRYDSARSSINGLRGIRASLIPHQIYIANEVSRRQAPRVLLADEVGLGKTIEAGMIMHSQINTHQISRVLILVPESLLHQWLVEMLRRFNLHFRIMNRDNFEATAESAPEGNPFLADQLILCSMESLLTDDSPASAQPGDQLDNQLDPDADQSDAKETAPALDMLSAVTKGQWDMLVVDEAHHLHWVPEEPSLAYTMVEQIAQSTPAVLLLTATPEQLGEHGHFARLKLLDPDRFSDFKQFRKEEKQFAATADLANALLADAGLAEKHIIQLGKMLGADIPTSESAVLKLPAFNDLGGIRDRLLTQLIDRHGTSRVLFRNTRSSIEGFPQRQLVRHSLEEDASVLDYAEWLVVHMQDLYPEKLLVICAQSETVLALAEALRRVGINSAQFHEGMSIIERDRSAAWFADSEEGCQVLICSEIGSEGRNFQFLHHLVMFELPSVPDLLEQRIGRLDRIGQKNNIQIHIPVRTGSRDDSLLRWFHEGLNAVEAICKVGTAVATQVETELQKLLEQASSNDKAFSRLIERSRALTQEYNQRLEQGRDRLLELNSNRTELIEEQLDELFRNDRSYALSDFMTRVFNCFGVDSEEQSNNSCILKPGDHMHVANFPGLKEDGMTITYDRDTALEREDFTFLSWDHPMVNAAMDLVMNEAFGQANAEIINTDLLPRGVLYLQAVVTYRCGGEKSLNVGRYFPAALNRFMLGSNRKDYTSVLDELDIDSMTKRADPTRIRRFLQNSRSDINLLIRYTESLAEKSIPAIVEQARQNIDEEFDQEIERLVTLQKHNPSVRPDEITRLRKKKQALVETLGTTHYELVAISVLVNL